MGLDITAYRRLTKVDALFDERGEPVDAVTHVPLDDYFKVWSNPDFPGRADGLEDGAVYTYSEFDHVFSRGYGSYNRWRETLAKLAGYPLDFRETFGVREASYAAAAWNGKINEGPFYELVNFADNEGVIGPVAATKLLRDFVEFDDRAKAITEEHFYEGYCDMRRGLELAADGGALDFH